MKMYASFLTDKGNITEQREIEISDEQYFRMIEENKDSEMNKRLAKLALDIKYVDLKPYYKNDFVANIYYF